MRLRYSPTSPYVRKVSVCAIEFGLAERIERIPTDTLDPKTDLAEHNPLVKVPALVLEDGEVLYDSPVICEYLDSLHDGAKIFPPAGPERWTALRQQALGDGILDAAILCMLETLRRPEALRWRGWIDKQTGKVTRASTSWRPRPRLWRDRSPSARSPSAARSDTWTSVSRTTNGAPGGVISRPGTKTSPGARPCRQPTRRRRNRRQAPRPPAPHDPPRLGRSRQPKHR